MKRLIRLIFVALAAWVAYKYLADRDIKAAQVVDKAVEWAREVVEGVEWVERVESSFAEASEDREVEGSFGAGLPDLNIRMEDDSPVRVQSPSVPDVPDPSTAVEYPVSSKMFSGGVEYAELDRYASETPPEAEKSMEALVGWLTEPASGELQKARLIFTWVATHVWYDDNGYNTGNYAGTSPAEVFRNRVSVCQGYSELFAALCNMAGIEAVTITGYSKGVSYRPGSSFSDTNHAWNAANIDGQWRLFDVTWASGYGRGVNGRLVTVHEFNDYWFNVNPNEAIFSHLPEDDRWQLNNPKITKYQFERLPYILSQYFKLGFSGDQCFPAVLDGTVQSLPEAYSVSGDIKVLSMPYSGRIPSGQTIRLRVAAGEGITPAYENGGRITDMTRDGNEYTALITTVPGEFRLMMTYGGGSYETALVYTVL